MSKNYHLGPYIRCKQEIVARERLQEGCEKCEKKFESSKFCNVCGSPKSKYKVLVKEPKVSHWDLNAGKDVDRISLQYCEPYKSAKHDKYVYYVNNSVQTPGVRHRSVSAYPDAYEITADIINGELDLFKRYMDYDIKRVEAAYGKENVSIHWGFLLSEER